MSCTVLSFSDVVLSDMGNPSLLRVIQPGRCRPTHMFYKVYSVMFLIDLSSFKLRANSDSGELLARDKGLSSVLKFSVAGASLCATNDVIMR